MRHTCVALSIQLSLNMASDASASASGSIGGSLKRILSPDILDSAREGPAPKKPKKETRLDKLVAQQKEDAVRLKRKIELELKLVKDKGVATEVMLECYCCLCDLILADKTLDEHALTLLKFPFADSFVEEDVLLEKLGLRM